MLGWLTRASRSVDGADHLETSGKDLVQLEPPETPAPVFAIRAFKTALFGTPQNTERTIAEIPEDVTASNALDALALADLCSTKVSDAPSRRESGGGYQAPAAETELLEPPCSPSKPAGILLTPGTAGGRRKTVSFGASVVDNVGRKLAHGERSGLPNNCPERFPSPWDRSTGSQGTEARTKLNKTLFDVRDVESKATSSQQKATGISKETLQRPETKHARAAANFNPNENDHDATVDLNDPRSQSGRYWKSEYSSYQDKTNEEMKRLVKYKQMAKSYAKKKDSEATDLGEKLREERDRVSKMEEQIQELAAQIATLRRTGGSSGPDQAQLMRDLARQTALALEYKSKVDDFQAALEGHTRSSNPEHARKGNTYTSPRTEKTLVQTSVELKKAREQLQVMKSLRAEIDVYRDKLEEAEKKTLGLEDERAALQDSLARVKEEMTKYEQRRDEKQRQREQKLQMERNRHQDRLLKMKLEYQQALQDAETAWNKERVQLEEQAATLGAAGKSYDSPQREDWDLEPKAAEPNRLKWQTQQRKILQELHQAREESSHLRIENERIRTELRNAQAAKADLQSLPQPPKSSLLDESLGDIWTQPDFKDGSDPLQAPLRELPGEGFDSKAVRTECMPTTLALNNRNMNVNAGSDTMTKQFPTRRSLSPEKHSIKTRYKNSSYHPSPPPSPIATKMLGVTSLDYEHAPYRTDDSPRPSMFNMIPSPPVMRPLSMPLHTATTHSRHNAASKGGNVGIRRSVSSRVGSLASASGRPSLPPDRVAAAKARLEQKNAEKRVTKQSGKENEGTQPA
ncbi:MAG: hypothetical protein M1835_004580 [Candelina submexicana]|nr:MAG: hypothetical protein M1835_004580 [Candelina submexicana]